MRAEVLTPERLNAFVIAGFAGVALLIAVVGVAGVLAFGVSARTREFGVRLAIGSTPRSLLMSVLSEGMAIVDDWHRRRRRRWLCFAGIAASYVADIQLPGRAAGAGARPSCSAARRCWRR